MLLLFLSLLFLSLLFVICFTSAIWFSFSCALTRLYFPFLRHYFICTYSQALPSRKIHVNPAKLPVQRFCHKIPKKYTLKYIFQYIFKVYTLFEYSNNKLSDNKSQEFSDNSFFWHLVLTALTAVVAVVALTEKIFVQLD